MKLRLLIVFLFVFGIVANVMAAPEDMVVSTWDLGCEHTMTTNHFELAPGEVVEITLDLTGCVDNYEGMLFFGYNTTKNSSRQLTARDGIRLMVVGINQEWSSDNGYLYITDLASNTVLFYAENVNKKKTMKIRLRSSIIW